MNITLPTSKSFRYILASAAAFSLTVIICVLLQPEHILSHEGLSYYGNLRRTFLPFGIGLSASSYFLLRACRTMAGEQTVVSNNFRIGLECIAVALLGIVATPSFSSVRLIQDMHVIFGFIIFVAQAFLSVRYLIRIRDGLFDWLLIALQLLAIALVGLSFGDVGILHVMLPAQVLAEVAFGTLLIRAISSVERAGPGNPQDKCR